MDEINPLKCANYIQATAPLFAKAKADRTFIENYLKTVKAQQMNASDSSSLGAKEADAYASSAYIEQLKGLREAVEQEENYRWSMTAAQAKIDIWKTTEFSRRAEIKNGL
tara:strand:+ start:259 stop:588 length:330 start_codon:yes stop_codon:yes gene_type:complete